MENPLSILRRASRVLKKAEKTLASDEIICACYLHRFRRDGKKTDFERFKAIFCNLTDDGKYQAINYYLTFAANSEKQKSNTRVLKK